MRVGADGSSSPREYRAGEVFRDHHRALYMHVGVDEAGNEVFPLAIIACFCRKDLLHPLFTHKNDKSVQNIYTGRIYLTCYHVKKLHVAYGKVAGYLTHCSLNEPGTILDLLCSQCCFLLQR